MVKLTAIIKKDLFVLGKDFGAISTLFLMPLVFIVVFSFALGGQVGGGQLKTKQKLPVVYRDAGPEAAKAVSKLRKLDGIKVEERVDKQLLTLKTANRLVARGDRSMVVIFPDDYSEKLRQGRETQVKVLVDPAAAIAQIGPLKGALNGVLKETAAAATMEAGMKDAMKNIQLEQIPPPFRQFFNPEAVGREMKKTMNSTMVKIKEERPQGVTIAKQPTPVQSNVAGYTTMFVFFIVTVIAESFLSERKEGTFRRLLAAPVGKATILIGKLAPYYLVNLIQISIMFGVGYFVFSMGLGRSPSGLALMSAALAAAAVGLGLLIASLVKTSAQAGGLSVLLVLTLAAVGGAMIPLEIMPPAMQSIAKISPHSWAISGFQDIIVRGYGLQVVAPKAGVLFGFAAVFFGLGLWKFKFE